MERIVDKESLGDWELGLREKHGKLYDLVLLRGPGMVRKRPYCRLITSYGTFCELCMYPCTRKEFCKNHFSDEALDGTLAVGIYFQRALAGKYHNMLSDHVLMLKSSIEFSKPLALAMILALKNKVFNIDIDEVYCLIPIPKHPAELKFDADLGIAYNQATELARHVAKRFNKLLKEDILVKKEPARMAGKGRDERKHLALRVYDVAKYDSHLRGKTILLVDDIRTSGATGHACARLLKEKLHAKKVYLLVAGRAVHLDWQPCPSEQEIY
ncbi:MAG: hypothetical protein DRN15_08765 [Thermoprotei archaeon]|nr:MAG: hypothetical protein DRN15_08765 [Thermoprotei archaeon]